MENIITAFMLTLIAGLSTVIGSSLALFTKSTNKKFLSVSLGFSAGVMIFVSFVEIYNKAQESLISYTDVKTGSILTAVAFFSGILIIAIIDKLIPSHDNPHEIKTMNYEDHEIAQKAAIQNKEDANKVKLKRMGIFTALAIAIHNFPEGLATFVTALTEPTLAIPIVVAIAIHNIPEGIAVSVPIYQATGSRKKAFFYSALSGLSEPVGALVGYLILMPFMSDLTFGLLFACVAGIMVFVSLDELLPSAREYGEAHLSIYGLIAGMAVMSISLLMFI